MATPQLKTYFQTYRTDHLGQIELTGILNIRVFDRVSLEILNHPNPIPNLTVTVALGKLSEATLGQEIDRFLLDSNPVIHTYDVVAPELTVWVLGAPPDTDVDLQAWVFLH